MVRNNGKGEGVAAGKGKGVMVNGKDRVMARRWSGVHNKGEGGIKGKEWSYGKKIVWNNGKGKAELW